MRLPPRVLPIGVPATIDTTPYGRMAAVAAIISSATFFPARPPDLWRP